MKEGMRVILERLALLVLSIVLAGLLVVFVMSYFSGGIRHSPRSVEAYTVRQLAKAVIMHAEEHNSILPETLDELEERDLIFDHRRASPERFIYVAPRNARLEELSPDSPIILFPWYDGVHIGYVGGNVIFVAGGNPKALPPTFSDERLSWIRIIIVSLMLNIIVIGLFVYRGRKRI
jgi:hypothetical protein